MMVRALEYGVGRSHAMHGAERTARQVQRMRQNEIWPNVELSENAPVLNGRVAALIDRPLPLLPARDPS